MFACNVYPRTTFHPLFIGTLLEPLGITILAVALRSGNLHLIYGMLALTGVGTGARFMPGTLHGVGYYPGQSKHSILLSHNRPFPPFQHPPDPSCKERWVSEYAYGNSCTSPFSSI